MRLKKTVMAFLLPISVLAHATAPGSFSLSQPVDGDSSQSTLPAFSWSPSSGAASYTIEVATSANFGTTDIISQSGLTSTSFAISSPLNPGTVYYWKVSAVNADGSTLASQAPFWFSLPILLGFTPGGVAVAPDGTRAYVTNNSASGTVSAIDLNTNAVKVTIPVGKYPGKLAVTPDGSKVLVNNGAGSNNVSVIDVQSGTVTNTISPPCVATTLYDIAVTPDGTRAVMGDLNSGCTQSGLDVVNISNGAISFINLSPFNGPFGVAATPDGSGVIATNGILGTTVKRIDLASGSATTITGTSSTFGVAVTPDGKSALVASGENDTVKRIDLASNVVTATIPYASNQDVHNIAIAPDGSTAVAVGDFDTALISLVSNTVPNVYPGGGGSVAITPDGKRALVTTSSLGGAIRIIPVGTSTAASVSQGWNLMGNGLGNPVTVSTLFGNASDVTTVWKWEPSGNNPNITYPAWAFFTPTQADGGSAYAAAHGYDFLTTINPGDGFWVNAKIPFTVSLSGIPISSTRFQNSSTGSANPLPGGWSLIAVGDNPTPSAFNVSVGATPPAAGVIPTNITTLWSWNAASANWYFYAPSLDANGTLASYIGSKYYLPFGTGTLMPTTGFWVNHP